MKKLITVIGVAVLALATAAQDFPTKPEGKTDWYGGDEFSIDLGAQYGVDRTGGDLFGKTLKGGDWAYSLGVQYYITPYVGIGADVYCLEPEAQQDASVGPGSKSLVKAGTINLLLRYPIKRFAVYALGGIGRDWHDGEYTLDAGGGIEYRLMKGIATYGEARYVWTYSEPGQMQSRFGLRVGNW